MRPRFTMTAAAAFTCAALAVTTLAQGELVIVKEGTGLYHRPGCAVIRDGRDVLAMNLGQANARGYKPHAECDPSQQPAPSAAVPDTAAPSRVKPKAPPAPIVVYVEPGGSHYHRIDCRTLGKEKKKVVLDSDTTKKYWPCPTCKPPIRPRPGRKGRNQPAP